MRNLESNSGDSAETVVRRVWKCNHCGKEFNTAMEGIEHFQRGECNAQD